ncbi:MAG: hypothetical protein HYZ28_26995 [Myxococcales bacterium]|nr:hypothetical protein [Myxococcales bacterium]
MRWVGVLCLLFSGAALAKPWHGIEPGVARRDDVVLKFGLPTRTIKKEGKEILAYLQKQAIRGTVQAQFRVDLATKLVDRIDVFPAPLIGRQAIESTYGRACPEGAPPKEPCYQKKSSGPRTYFLYSALGLAIFFNEDGKTVQSFVFQPAKK